MNGGVGERGRYRRGEMGPGHGDRDGIELDPVDPRRTVPEELPDHPVDPPAEEEDAARIGVLQGGQVDEGFRLRPSGFEGEGVVLEDGDLSGEARYGYPCIRRIAGLQEPSWFQAVIARSMGDQFHRRMPITAATHPAMPRRRQARSSRKRNRVAAAAIRAQATVSGKF